MDYKIGSFNLHNIGVSALGEKNQRNLRIIANIIESEKFDIIALQEVLSEGKAFVSKDYTKKCILNELGGEDKWGFEWADATNDDFGGLNNNATNKDSRGEGYAFIWNKSRIRLCSTEVFTPYGPTERKFYPRMLNQMNTEMFRKPFYGRFTSADVNGGAFVEFRLICIHTYYGKSDNSESRMIRQREIDNVLKEIYPLMCDKRYGNNMPAYTIVLGDYNAEVWTSESKKWQEPLKIERYGKFEK